MYRPIILKGSREPEAAPPSKGSSKGFSPGRRRFLKVFLILALIAGVIVEERLRGQWKLAAVKAAMVQRGQIADIMKLLPPPATNYQAFTNRIGKVTTLLGNSLMGGGGNMVEATSGKAARGSQAPHPIVWDKISWSNGHASPAPGSTNTWAKLDQRYATNQAALAELRELLRDPPATRGDELRAELRGETGSPNYVAYRVGAQTLNDVVVLELHRGDLKAAEENLIALGGFLRHNSQAPELVAQMIRVAIEGLGASTLWDAIQAEGWTEAQLEHIQTAWQLPPPMVPDVVASLHASRVAKLESYNLFRRESVEQWDARYRKILNGFGAQTPPFYKTDDYFFHPLWNFAWADQEMAAYLERTDFITTSTQAALKEKAFANLEKEWARNIQDAHPPLLKWRYYLELPLVDRMSDIIGSAGSKPSLPSDVLHSLGHLGTVWFLQDFAIPNFARACTVAARNENSRAMAVTSLALKRYQLRNSRLPDKLTALVPDFLPGVPLDWMDGKPLRYQLKANGTYLLYSVGEDGKDDGGDPTPVEAQGSKGRDQVWPTMVPWEK